MHKLILIAVASAVLAGCAGGGGYTARGYSDPLRSESGGYDDRYWPPVVPGQAFPAQIMDGGSPD
jgi:hypothetical protein